MKNKIQSHILYDEFCFHYKFSYSINETHSYREFCKNGMIRGLRSYNDIDLNDLKKECEDLFELHLKKREEMWMFLQNMILFAIVRMGVI